jgi:hypothetical protein
MSVFAAAMAAGVAETVDKEQTAFIKGRDILDTALAVMDVEAYAARTSTPGVVGGLDLKGGYNCLDRGWILSVLKHVGFGPRACALFSAFHVEGRVFPLINGWLGESFAVRRSVRQGCPAAPQLFILALEPMLHMLRLNPGATFAPFPAPSTPGGLCVVGFAVSRTT